MLVRKSVYCLLFIVPIAIGISFSASSQGINEKLRKAFESFENDSQLRAAISSLYVVDAKTGEVVFNKNGYVGLPTASTLKVITAASAYEMLGKDFRYETQFRLVNFPKKKSLLRIYPSGDPSLGTWRWPHNNRFNVMKRLMESVRASGNEIFEIRSFEIYDDEDIPGGWIWDDIANYYGAGAQSLNWNENQFDVVLASGDTIGSSVNILGTNPPLFNYGIYSELRAAATGTGDNAYIYFPVVRKYGVIRGTIPLGEKRFVISGAMPSAKEAFIGKLTDTMYWRRLFRENIKLTKEAEQAFGAAEQIIHREVSPHLDSLVYWFLKRSINLYGEAFVKTIARIKTKKPTTDSGLDTVISFWKQKGIDPAELRMVDGSGLSPLNRVTTHAQVQVLQYAKNQPWFKGYYDAFPEYNKMKMKSGTIQGAKGFCGYHKAADGNEYIFSFLVNNYNGSASKVVEKMYKVLDVLK